MTEACNYSNLSLEAAHPVIISPVPFRNWAIVKPVGIFVIENTVILSDGQHHINNRVHIKQFSLS